MENCTRSSSCCQRRRRPPCHGRTSSEFQRTRRKLTATVGLLLFSTCCEAGISDTVATVVNTTNVNSTLNAVVSVAHPTDVSPAVNVPSKGKAKKKQEPIVEVEEEDVEPIIEEKMKPVPLPPLPPQVPNNPTLRFDDESSQDDDLFQEQIFVREKSPPVIPPNILVLLSVAWIISLVFTAWQMSDYPDGLYASLCRLVLSGFGLVVQIVTSPCRKCCGGSNESYGRISTMDYGYKDPALELA